MMDDFYTSFLQDLPRDEWGHPTLPTPEKIHRREYATHLLALQIELVKMQQWARANGERVLLLFEGRDTAGKGGTIQRMREHMNPRFARHVALPAPNETEGGQWYFQRYVEQLPTRGEITFFDRSWYNRAGVERVMHFATDAQVERFFEQVVPFEQFLVDDGIHLIKIWLSVGRDEQVQRLGARRQDPLKQWKLSPLDEQGPALWEDYTLAALELFRRTDTPDAPWWFVNNNNKRVGRLNAIQHVLNLLPYQHKRQEHHWRRTTRHRGARSCTAAGHRSRPLTNPDTRSWKHRKIGACSRLRSVVRVPTHHHSLRSTSSTLKFPGNTRAGVEQIFNVLKGKGSTAAELKVVLAADGEVVSLCHEAGGISS